MVEKPKKNKKHIMSEELLWSRLEQKERASRQLEQKVLNEVDAATGGSVEEFDACCAAKSPAELDQFLKCIPDDTDVALQTMVQPKKVSRKKSKKKPPLPAYGRMSDLAYLLGYEGRDQTSSARKFCQRNNVPTYYLRSAKRDEDENTSESIVLKEDIEKLLKESEKKRRKLFEKHPALKREFPLLASEDYLSNRPTRRKKRQPPPPPTSFRSLCHECEDLEDRIRYQLNNRLKYYVGKYTKQKNNDSFPKHIDETPIFPPPPEVLEKDPGFREWMDIIDKYHSIDFDALVGLCDLIDRVTSGLCQQKD